MRKSAARSYLFLNEDLISVILDFLPPTKILPAMLTSKSFLRVCHNLDLTHDVKTSIVHFCHSRNALRWLLACGCPSDRIPHNAIRSIAYLDEHKAIAMLEYMKHEGLGTFSANTMICVVEKGYFDAVRWLRSQDPPCPWDEATCAAAARTGNLILLQWLRSQEPPCPWDGRTFYIASESKQYHVLHWLLSHECFNGFYLRFDLGGESSKLEKKGKSHRNHYISMYIGEIIIIYFF